MLKTIIPFYIVSFLLYTLFSRRPDYQDGQFTTAVIHYIQDSTQKTTAMAVFTVDKINYTVNASYPLRNLKEAEPVKVIYDTSNPANAAVYLYWGYWLQWDELLASILIPFILLYAARAITAGPTPKALMEEIEMRDSSKRRKYD